jgi:hypothetical protein
MGAIALWLLFALLSPQALADDEDGVVSIALTPEERSWVAENAVVVGIEPCASRTPRICGAIY